MKTIMEMAREAGAIHIHERPKEFAIVGNEAITRFAALVREEAQRKPLTDEQLLKVIKTIDRDEQFIQQALRHLARAIEAAHGITAATQLKE